jgi:Fe-S-cluster containining protein
LRTEFGFERTSCDCWRCTRYCKRFPGYMVPADLPRMMEQAGYSDPFAYAKDFLEASLGAIAVRKGIPFRVKSLRPACLPKTTQCIHLDEDNHCRIHEVSPYGCAFVDDHMTNIQFDQIGRAGLETILMDQSQNGLYTQVWNYLWNDLKKRARDPFAKDWAKLQKHFHGTLS